MVGQLKYLTTVFNNTEKYRTERFEELRPFIKQSTYSDTLQGEGKVKYDEYVNLELWYKPLLMKSMFLIAYATFELQLGDIALKMEEGLPKKVKLESLKKK